MKPDAATFEKPAERVAAPSKVADVLVLAKVRLNALVVVTTAGGYYMAAGDRLDLAAMALACLGTALVASGAAGINQVIERRVDKAMERTRLRPLADGRMSVGEGVVLSCAMAILGLTVLALAANPVATALALTTLLVYVGIYTPLKRYSSLATIVGAVPGALPPLIGWAAAGGSIAGVVPWTLFLIMFVWQLPHFLAISWIYREDYARAGLRMLAVVDKHGGVTGRQAALWAATLIPFSLLPIVFGLADGRYAVGALILGGLQLAMALRFAAHRSEVNARRLFYASITYLPLLWMLLAVGRR